MTAHHAGSNAFVPPVFVSSEANHMYENMVRVANGNGTAAWRADLRDYARWEYGRNAEAWLLATARRTQTRRRRRPGLRARVRAWLRATRSLPATTAVADVENRRR